MNLSFNAYKDFVCICGSNGSGKTVMVENLFVKRVEKQNIFVINSGYESSWESFVPKNHILVPLVHELDWLEQSILKIASLPGPKLLIIDDVDNFQIKKSQKFMSVVINARRAGMGIILITRMLSSIPIYLYQQSKYSFFARQNSDYSIYYIARLIGIENSTKLKNLELYSFMIWDLQNSTADIVKLGGVRNTQQVQASPIQPKPMEKPLEKISSKTKISSKIDPVSEVNKVMK